MRFLKKHALWFVAGMLAVFFVVSLRLAWDDSATMDEKAHIPASYSYVRYLDMRINPEHPPLIKDLSGLAMLLIDPLPKFPVPSDLWSRGDEDINPADHPEGAAKSWGLAQWSFGDQFLFGMGNDPNQITFFARLPIICIAVLLGLAIFLWTRELAGTVAGLFALLLYVADPNVLGHDHLVTTDVGIAAFVFFSVYFFVRFLRNPSAKNTILLGMFLGLANLAKFSAVTLFPLFSLLAVIYALSKARPETVEGERPQSWRWKSALLLVLKFAGSIAVSFLVIWALYLPNTWNMPAETIQEIARAQFPNDRVVGRFAESTVIAMSGIAPLKPLAQYFLGVFMVFARVSGGNTYYFLGNISNQATALYFPAVFLMKSTLPFLAILLFGLCYGSWRATKSVQSRRKSGQKWIAILSDSFQKNIAPYTMLGLVVFYAYLSITGNLNIGFRHLFPILPFLYTLGSKAVFDCLKRCDGSAPTASVVRGFIFLFSCWIILIPILAYPSFLSYFNTAMGGHSEGYKYVTDSNYDWGQDAKRLKIWVDNYNSCVESGATESSVCRSLTGEKSFPTASTIQKIRVDYFGGSSPEYFLGDTYEPWHSNNSPEPGWYAVSAEFYQGSIYDPNASRSINYSWFPHGSLVGRAGDSIFIFYVDKVPGQE